MTSSQPIEPAIITSRPSNLNPGLVYAAKGFLILYVIFYLIEGLFPALIFDGAPVNGPFQLFNPLRRIAAGQVGGKDFIFFHGIGIPYLHYPLFALFGANSLIASELSRQWTSVLLFVLSFWAFVRATLGKSANRWVAAALAIIALEAVFPHGPAPGHSLISARSTMPLFAFAALQLPVGRLARAVLTGSCIGLGFVFGTEHAIAMVLALATVTAISLAISTLQRIRSVVAWETLLGNIRFAAIAMVAAVFTAASLLVALCGVEGMRKALRYSLLDLPGDQFWFFGSPPMPFLGAWREFLFDRHVSLTLLPTYVTLGILGWLLFRQRRHRLVLGGDWRGVAIWMLVYGILSGIPMIAILSRHYVFPLARILVLVAILLYANGALPSMAAFLNKSRWPRLPVLAAYAAIAMMAATGIGIAIRSTGRLIAISRHVNAGTSTFSKYLDSDWDTFMTQSTQLIDSTRQREKLSLWSAYSALLESHYGVLHPAEDYIIHTAGPERWGRYLARFRDTNPEFVTTQTNQFSFEEWLENERWEFFEDVLNNYDPLRTIKHATIWHRKDEPWQTPSRDFTNLVIEPGSGTVTLPVPAGAERLGVVRVYYTVTNPMQKIPLFGKTPRLLVEVESSPRHKTVSVPPYATEFQFPVQLPADRPVKLRFTLASLLPGVVFQPTQVQFKVLKWTPSQRTVFAPGT